ncbi:MAG: cysteine desulfurase family protein [Bryobacteraceae bacterium]
MPRIYLDHNATTPVSPDVARVFAEAVAREYGNASSVHQEGQTARRALDGARGQVAARIGAHAREMVFTSGGTESVNLAVLGYVRALGRRNAHVVTSAIEHPAVLNAARQLEREGRRVSFVAPGRDGVVDPASVEAAMTPETVLVSVAHANNETGAIQPVADIAVIARARGIAMHSDGVQAAGKIPVDVAALGVDLYSISGHKFHAPKGSGALWVRSGVKLEPLQWGGRHEHGRRPGTENVPGAVAMGAAAAAIADADLAPLRDRLERAILAAIPGVAVNGAGAPRLPNTSNLTFDGIEGEALVIALDLRGFAISSGSACSSGAVEPSHVLLAMGRTPREARSSIRVSLGAGNTREEVDAFVESLSAAVGHLRRLSPDYVPAHA